MGKPQEKHGKVIGTPLENHRKILRKIIGTSSEHRRAMVYPWVFARVFSRICRWCQRCCRGSSGILACPGVSCCVLAYLGGVVRNLTEICRALRKPAASKKPRFPFLCTHRFIPECCFEWQVQYFRGVHRNKGDLFLKGSLGRPLGSLGRLLGGFWGPLGGLLGRLGGLLGCLGDPLGVS